MGHSDTFAVPIKELGSTLPLLRKTRADFIVSFFLPSGRGMGGCHDHTPPLLSRKGGAVMATFLLSFWECCDNDNVTISFLSQEEKRQRP